MFVRPAATRFAPPTASTAALPGTVIDVAYRGRGYDHVFRCAAGNSPVSSPVEVAPGCHVGSASTRTGASPTQPRRMRRRTGSRDRCCLGITTAETGVVDVVGTGLLAGETGMKRRAHGRDPDVNVAELGQARRRPGSRHNLR